MKSKIFVLVFSLVLSVLLFSFKAQSTCGLVLTNAKTNKSIKVCDSYQPDKIEAIFGHSISMDKEQQEKDEAPILTFTYDGLELVMQNNKVINLTITNKKWKLNGFTIGTLLSQVEAKHERYEAKHFKDLRFKVKDSKALIFVEVDETSKLKKLQVVF